MTLTPFLHLEYDLAEYAAFGDRFDTEAVHALALRTHTPEAWKQLNASA